MKKVIATALLAASVLVSPAWAADKAADVSADQQAIAKDKAALQKDQDKLNSDRSVKADAKANKQYGTEASKSAAIASDKTMIGEKKAEQNVDQKILNHDEKKAGDMAPASGSNQ